MKPKISIDLLENNEGQIEGLPKNPRFIRDEDYIKLLGSIKEDMAFLNIRGLMVYPVKDKYVVIGGNQRLTACKEAGMTEIPCEILPKKTTLAELRRYTIKDNASFGEWDYGYIEVSGWLDIIRDEPYVGLDLPEKMKEHLANGFKEVNQNLNLDYTLFFNSKEECDMFYEFLVKLNNKFADTDNVSKRILRWVAELYEENEQLEESQLLMKLIGVDMAMDKEKKPTKKNYKDVKL